MKNKKKDKKKKVKMEVQGYYTDDNGFWTIYKTEVRNDSNEEGEKKCTLMDTITKRDVIQNAIENIDDGLLANAKDMLNQLKED